MNKPPKSDDGGKGEDVLSDLDIMLSICPGYTADNPNAGQLKHLFIGVYSLNEFPTSLMF